MFGTVIPKPRQYEMFFFFSLNDVNMNSLRFKRLIIRILEGQKIVLLKLIY